MAALSFTRLYTDGELVILCALVITTLSLLGLLANAILGSRGFGIAMNAVLIAGGGLLAYVFFRAIVQQAGFAALGISPIALFISLMCVCALITLLGAAFLKRLYG
ncbi:MAG: hypothetical protein BGP06_06335 [Rhizobiales bacterium 65-9]|nr:hypothetical protein [Hyphomicrobiales bacterium]OJY35461.1 MAG: hypothetical protein BGP06_06335 [Rhizobiales bacterium 65-9]